MTDNNFCIGTGDLKSRILFPLRQNDSAASNLPTTFAKADNAELISSPRMPALTVKMKQVLLDHYILLISLPPPFLIEPDTLPFKVLLNFILIVDHPKRSNEIQIAFAMIPRERFIGFLLNNVEPSDNEIVKQYT